MPNPCLRAVRCAPILCALLALGPAPGAPSYAGCPPGESSPITSGSGFGRPPVVFPNLGGAPAGRFFVLGSERSVSSGSLPVSAWLVNLGDLDGDGLPEYRVEAPGEGAGGWGDPRSAGCPSTLAPPRPPIAIEIRHEREDLDGDGRFDIFEDRNGNRRLDPGEDRDGDGRLTPAGGCEGEAREDVDCDGHADLVYEDRNGNGILDVGEDLDGDGRLDLISEDRDFDGVLDPDEDWNGNGRLDVGPYIEDRNHNQTLDDRSILHPDDLIYAYLPDGSRVILPAWYPYGSFVPAPGGLVTALVAWSGVAYDLSVMPRSTRLAATPQDLDVALPKR